MNRYTFLNTRQPEDAWASMLPVLKETRFELRPAAAKLKVSRTALYAWFKKNPSYKDRLEHERASAFEL